MIDSDSNIGLKVITIDGPASSGKSSVALELARKHGFLHLNSGLLYRAVGFLAAERGLDLADEDSIIDLARATNFSFRLAAVDTVQEPGLGTRTEFIASGISNSAMELGLKENSLRASRVALLPGLRELLTKLQRDIVGNSMVTTVLEGRDAGTVVFPDAKHKFYLDADIKTRAFRRFAELNPIQEPGELNIEALEENPAYLILLKELQSRDEQDMSREFSPSVAAADAIKIDTTKLSRDEVVDRISALMNF